MNVRSGSHPSRPRGLRAAALVTALAALLAACGDDEPATTTVGGARQVVVTYIDGSTVSELMSEIYAQTLEQQGFRVGRRNPVADRDAALAALAAGQVHLVPDATGDLLTHYEAGTPTEPAPRTVDEEVAALKAKLPATISVGTAALAEDKAVVACRDEVVTDEVLSTMTDLGMASAGLTLGTTAQSEAGPLSATLIAEHYRAEFEAVTTLADDAAVAAALTDGTIDCLVTVTTDPVVSDNDMTMLSDDKAIVRPNALMPVLNIDGATPQVLAVLDGVSAQVTTDLLNEMMAIIAKGTHPDVMAQTFVSNVASL